MSESFHWKIWSVSVSTIAGGWLDRVYGDLAQESLLTDNAAIAAQRLDELQAQYRDRLTRQLKSQLNGYQRVKRALEEALAAVDAMTPQDPEQPD